jgi:hypothetical protein
MIAALGNLTGSLELPLARTLPGFPPAPDQNPPAFGS